MDVRNRRGPGSHPVEALEGRTLLSVSLVKDINATPSMPYGPPTSPSPALSLGDVALFASTAVGNNVELWRTDGTAGGTYQLPDLRPGDAASLPHAFMRAGDLGYFVAGTDTALPSVGGNELWRSDGTAAGTLRVFDTNPAGHDAPAPVAAVGDRLFFLANDPAHGIELWVTDGTAAGTHFVKDQNPGTANTSIPFAGAQGNRLLFQTAAQPTVLYATDGTDAGTVSLGTVGKVQKGFIAAGGMTYFVDTAGSLWRTDGTAAGTAKVLDRQWPNGTLRFAAGGADGSALLDVSVTGQPERLARYDPATGLTPLTRDNGIAVGAATSMGVVGSTYYFARSVGTPTLPQYALYRLAPGSVVAEKVPGAPIATDTNSARQFNDFTAARGKLYFRARGPEIWSVADPEAGGQAALGGVLPVFDPAAGLVPLGLSPLGGGVVTVTYDRQAGWGLFKSDGTPAGAGMYADISPVTLSAIPSMLTPFKGKVLFAADDGTGIQPWVTDGTTAGTVKLASSLTGPVWGIAAAGQQAFFTAGASLWVTDGTPAGTQPVTTFLTTPGELTPSPRPGESGMVYFRGSDGLGSELWRSDGTANGTYRVKDIRTVGPNGGDSNPAEFTPLPDGTLVFVAEDDSHGRELWQTDGTAGGTHLFKNITPDDVQQGRFPTRLTRVGDFVYFSADDGVHGAELWRTDGTPAGTAMVADLEPGPGGSLPGEYADFGHAFVAHFGRVYFQAMTGPSAGLQLWSTDGTAPGTFMIRQFSAPPSQPVHLRIMNDRLYFTVNESEDPANPGANLWTTDGTPQGTAPVMPAGTMEAIDDLAVINGKLYFRGWDPATHNPQLFTSDGAPAGTFEVDDLGGDRFNAGVSGEPVGLPDGSLLAPGDDGVVGEELFRYDDPWAPRVVARHVFYNHSAFDGSDADINADDAVIATDKVALLPGEAPTFANITSYSRGINGILFDVIGDLVPTALAGILANVTVQASLGGAAPWTDAPRPLQGTIRPGAGFHGSGRIALTWPDGAIRNRWLRVTINPIPQIGFPGDTFVFGNLVGDAGDGAAPFAVDGADVLSTRAALGARGVAITAAHDFNRDGVVNAADYALVRRGVGAGLTTPPAAAAQRALAVPRRRPVTRSVLDDTTTLLLTR